jgi:hypothetical protein
VLTVSQPKSLSGRSEIIIVALALAALLAAEWVLTSAIPGTQYAQGDGKMAQAIIHTAFQFGGLFEVNNINPLQGFGSQLLPHNVWLNPAYWPFAILEGRLALDISAVISLGFLALASYVMARCFDVPVLPSIVAAQLSIILFGPLALLLIFYQVFWINPGFAVVYAPHLVALGILGRLQPDGIKNFIFATGGIFALLLYSLICDPLWTMISGIGFVPAFAVVVLSPLRIRPILVRCAALACCVVLLLICGAGEYLYTLSRYSTRVWFSEELAYVPAPTLASIAVISPKTMGAFYAICALGLLLGLLFARGRMRVLVVAGAVSVAFSLAYGAAFLMMRKWWLPLPLYVEHGLFLLLITATVAGYWAALRATGRLASLALGHLRDKVATLIHRTRQLSPASARPAGIFLTAATWLGALVVAAFIPVATASYGVRIAPTLPDYHAPFPNEPELVRYLEHTIGLRLGGEFRGSLTSVAPPPPADAPSLYNLWMHNIPTANEYSQLITPQAMYFPSALLKYDIVLGSLNQFALWIGPDFSYDMLFNTLQALGVHYVIVYDRFQEAEKRHFPFVTFPRRPFGLEPTKWLVYKLPNPNLGNYSPTEVAIAKSGPEIIAAISAPEFDFTKQVVVSMAIDEPLVPANNMRLSLIRGGLHVSGSSNGTSLVVLPQQFSHCLRAHDTRVRLVRANLLVTGLIFSGNVDTDITFDYGIFSPACRRIDLADTTELLGRPRAAGGRMFVDWDEAVARFRAVGAASLHQGSPPAPPPPEEPAPSGPAITVQTVLADLPPSTTPGFTILGILGLNAGVEEGSPVVSGQPILRLVAVPTSGRHYLAAQFTGLDKDRVYRITGWVKGSAAVKVEMQASDELNPRGGTAANYGNAFFDPAAGTVWNASGLLKGRGIEQGPDEWRKIWIDLATSSGDIIVVVGLVSRHGPEFKGDGHLGLTFGGIEVAARN